MKLDSVWSIEVKAIMQFRKMASFVKAMRIGLIEKYLNNKRNKEVEKKIGDKREDYLGKIFSFPRQTTYKKTKLIKKKKNPHKKRT